MLDSSIHDLVHRVMEIEAISEMYALSYDDIVDKSMVAEEIGVAFKHTVSIKEEDFYIHIKKINEETAMIEQYAVGIEKSKTNILRFDNAKDHHSGLMYDPHHKHVGERVLDYDGKIDTLINELSDYYKNRKHD